MEEARQLRSKPKDWWYLPYNSPDFYFNATLLVGKHMLSRSGVVLITCIFMKMYSICRKQGIPWPNKFRKCPDKQRKMRLLATELLRVYSLKMLIYSENL